MRSLPGLPGARAAGICQNAAPIRRRGTPKLRGATARLPGNCAALGSTTDDAFPQIKSCPPRRNPLSVRCARMLSSVIRSCGAGLWDLVRSLPLCPFLTVWSSTVCLIHVSAPCPSSLMTSPFVSDDQEPTALKPASRGESPAQSPLEQVISSGATFAGDASIRGNRNPARHLHRKAWAAFLGIAALLLLQQALVEPRLAQLTSDAPVINVAGRQRMLSQRLVKSALALERSRTADEVARWRASVIAVLSEWRTAHRGLRQGDASLRLPPTTHPQLVAAFDALEPHFESMSAAAEDLISLARLPDADMRNPGLLDAVERLLSHEAEFLTRMHAIVGLYEAEARDHVADLQMTGWLLAISVILVALASQLAVLQPAISLLGRRMEQSERQYRLLVESMSDGLVLLDAMGRIRFANPRFCEMTGLVSQPLDGSRSSPAASTKPTDLLFTHCVDTTDIPVWLEILREAEPKVKQAELLLKVTNGCSLPVLVSARRFPRETGYHAALLLVISDISARKASEIRMRGLHEQLSHATRLKSMGEMATALAHEINQPLGAIANFAEGGLAQLSSTPAGESTSGLRTALERILRAAIRGGEIIRRARQFVSPVARETACEDVNALLTDVEQLCLPEARLHGIHLELDLDRTLSPLVVDGIQLQQVVTNLVQNSLQAIRGYRESVGGFDSGRITLRSGSLTGGGVRIEVEDDGLGIPPANAALVFDPFFTTRSEGTGMGLTIVRNIVEAHGGRVSFQPRRPHGTIFTVEFPMDIEHGVTPVISGVDNSLSAPVHAS